jgi:hypothetical protein
MKTKIKWLLLMFIVVSAACNRGPREWNSFKQKYAGKGTTIRLNRLMKLGLQVFAHADHDPETQALMHILKKMQSIEINIIPRKQAQFASEEINHLSYLLNKSDYESLVNIRKGSQVVNVWARGDRDTFSDPLALINDGDEVILVEMKGALTAEDIQMLADAGMSGIR